MRRDKFILAWLFLIVILCSPASLFAQSWPHTPGDPCWYITDGNGNPVSSSNLTCDPHFTDPTNADFTLSPPSTIAIEAGNPNAICLGCGPNGEDVYPITNHASGQPDVGAFHSFGLINCTISTGSTTAHCEFNNLPAWRRDSAGSDVQTRVPFGASLDLTGWSATKGGVNNTISSALIVDNLIVDFTLASSYHEPIVDVVQASKRLDIPGDQTAFFQAGVTFQVTGSSGNNGTYTVSSVSHDSGTDTTRIVTTLSFPVDFSDCSTQNCGTIISAGEISYDGARNFAPPSTCEQRSFIIKCIFPSELPYGIAITDETGWSAKKNGAANPVVSATVVDQTHIDFELTNSYASTSDKALISYDGTGNVNDQRFIGLVSGGLVQKMFPVTDFPIFIGAGSSPLIAISSPTFNPTYTTGNAAIALSGTASDDVGVTSVTWSCDVCGSGTASGTNFWSIASIALQLGVNVITVSAHDADKNTTNVVLTVTRITVTNQLVLALALDAGSGTVAADSSGLGNHGAFGAGVSWDNAGKYGKALRFDGTSAVTIPPSASLNLTTGMTLEAWVNPSSGSLNNWRTVVVGNYEYYLYAASGDSSCGASLVDALGGFHSSGGDISACDTTSLSVGNWTHLATTYDGTVLRYYRDGSLVRSVNTNASMLAGLASVQVGGSQFGEYFVGSIDDVRIYNYARQAQEIAQDMNTPIIPVGVVAVKLGAPSSLMIGAGSTLKVGK